jgi:hypothetical protein
MSSAFICTVCCSRDISRGEWTFHNSYFMDAFWNLYSAIKSGLLSTCEDYWSPSLGTFVSEQTSKPLNPFFWVHAWENLSSAEGIFIIYMIYRNLFKFYMILGVHWNLWTYLCVKIYRFMTMIYEYNYHNSGCYLSSCVLLKIRHFVNMESVSVFKWVW